MATNGAGKLIREVRDLCGLKKYDLGLDARTVYRWEKDGFPSRPEPESLQALRERLGILESDLTDANAGRPPALETFALSHPHRSLLSLLRQKIQDRHQLEVIGPPDVLFDKIAECIQISVQSVGLKSVVRVDARELDPTTFECVRVVCAKALGLSEKAQEDDFYFKKEAEDKDWVLLLHGADICCSNYYQRLKNRGVETIVSRWCSYLSGLRVPYIFLPRQRNLWVIDTSRGEGKPGPDLTLGDTVNWRDCRSAPVNSRTAAPRDRSPETGPVPCRTPVSDRVALSPRREYQGDAPWHLPRPARWDCDRRLA